MAIVVLSHRAPGNTTLLPLLERVTSLAVLEIQEGMVLEPNHIFLMPPRVHMTMNGLSFHLTVNYRPGLLDSINVFLVSLAASIGARAITVILSGAANDGCAALPAIKAVGGLTFAQSGAEFDSMPRHAIGTGRIDHILSAAGIGDYLARMF
jgi:two-component system CheB/CheR fusion protein